GRGAAFVHDALHLRHRVRRYLAHGRHALAVVAFGKDQGIALRTRREGAVAGRTDDEERLRSPVDEATGVGAMGAAVARATIARVTVRSAVVRATIERTAVRKS